MLLQSALRLVSRRIGHCTRRWLHEIDIAALKDLIGHDRIADSNVEKYTTDWTASYEGGRVVCFPRCTQDVSAVLKYCNEKGIGVVPQGGNTGLVGGSVARSSAELIMSLSKMNKIIDIDTDSRVLYCEAGCVLEALMEAVSAVNLVIPLDLGAKGSCMIGGNVSTNAGGLRVIKYGSMHANVLGLEVVLPNGEVLDGLRGLRKDNCGYQLNHLFIGSEGTLGVITRIAIALHSKPSNVHVALLKVMLIICCMCIMCFAFSSDIMHMYLCGQVSSYRKIPLLLNRFRSAFGNFLTAFEYMDPSSIAVVSEMSPSLLTRWHCWLFSHAMEVTFHICV